MADRARASPWSAPHQTVRSRLARSEQCKGSDRAFWMCWVHDGWCVSPLLSNDIVQTASRCPTASRRAVRDPEISLSRFRNTKQNPMLTSPTSNNIIAFRTLGFLGILKH
jgi:hypothetical protein